VGDLGQLGRVLIVGGAALLACGLLLLLLARVLPGGRLPGDIVFSRGSVTCLIPLATSLLLSVILTILLNLWTRR
jgi:hypothetical protein